MATKLALYFLKQGQYNDPGDIVILVSAPAPSKQ